jgi:hypothetical protein
MKENQERERASLSRTVYSLSSAPGRQSAYYYAHLSLSLRALAPHQTQLDSITFLIPFHVSVTHLGFFFGVTDSVGVSCLYAFRVSCFDPCLFIY